MSLPGGNAQQGYIQIPNIIESLIRIFRHMFEIGLRLLLLTNITDSFCININNRNLINNNDIL